MTTSVTPFAHVLEQFIDESSFLWALYQSAQTAPNYNPEKRGSLKERLEAQLDGLRSCGEDGWNAVMERISEKPIPGELFSAAVLALDSSDDRRLDTVFDTIAKPDHARELSSAFTWFSFEKTKSFYDKCFESSLPLLRLAGLSACATFRHNPGIHLDNALNDSDPFLRCRALQMIGELNIKEKMPVAKEHFSDEDFACSFRAAWSAALSGEKTAIQLLLDHVTPGSIFADEAVIIAVRKAAADRRPAIIRKLCESADLKRWAIIGAGAQGDISRVPELLDNMQETEFCRAAGEAFSMITGVDIMRSNLDEDEPEDFDETPNDDPEDERVDLDADHFLPWPDPQKVKAWWEENAENFTSGIRYLCGKPITEEELRAVLINGYQRQRYAASIEHMQFKPDEPLIDILVQV